MNKQCRLTIRSLGQLLDRAVPRDVAQFAAKNFVGPPKQAGRSGKLFGKIFSHADDLCTLSRK